MRTLAPLFALALAAVNAVAQQQPLSETIEVRVTNVDVVVTDARGNPVPGLTKDDFEVVEGGASLPITNFFEVRDNVTVAAVPAPGEAAATATATAAAVPAVQLPPRRIIVFIDQTSIHPQARNAALQALENSFSALMRPGDQATLVTWDRSREVLVPMTAERDLVQKSFRELVGRSSGGFAAESARSTILERAQGLIEEARLEEEARTASPGEGITRPVVSRMNYPLAYEMTSSSVQAYAERLWGQQRGLIVAVRQTLASVTGLEGKKILIFVGAELTDNPGDDLRQQVEAMFGSHIHNIKKDTRDVSRSLSADLAALANDANASGVTMYMVDTREYRSIDASKRRPTNAEGDFAAESSTKLTMSTIADLTGGVSVPGGKQFEAALTTIARDLGSYYSIGYRSPSSAEAGRRMEVRVNKPGLRVRSRQGYAVRAGAEVVQDRITANLLSDVQSDFPIGLVASDPEKQPDGRYKVILQVTFPTSMTLIPEGDELRGEFAVSILVGRPDGATSKVATDTKPMKFPKGSEAQLAAMKTFTYSAPVLLGSGEQIISVGVTDKVAGTSGYAKTRVVTPQDV